MAVCEKLLSSLGPRVSLGFMEANPRHHIIASINVLYESQEKDNSLETGL